MNLVLELFAGVTDMSGSTLSADDWRRIADLWHELGEEAPSDVASLAGMLLERLAPLTGAHAGFVVFGVSPERPAPELPLGGWQPQLMTTPLSDPAVVALVTEYMGQADFARDMHAEHVLDARGALRACALRETISLRDYLDSPAGWLWSALDVGDRLTCALPLADGLELLVGLDRARSDRRFGERDALFVREVLRGLARPARDVARAHGLLDAETPLSAREHEVLRFLLGGRSEKQIAAALGLTPGSTHQVIVRIFRKFGVQSRAELMALWIGGRDPAI